MDPKHPEDDSPDQQDQTEAAEHGPSPDSLPSGAGPQAEGDQSDISSGGGTDS